jgi:ABC-2 type transport system ATP-binding protein
MSQPTAPTRDVLAVNAVDVTKTYGSLTAVDRITVQVAQGEVYGVLGPNGAGKTTFLRMLFGLIRPDSGTLEVFGRSWDTDGTRTLDGVAGFIESPKFYPGLTGRKNLQLLAGLDGGTSSSRLEEVVDIVDLTGREDDKVGGYSFGMRQRLGVAASLLRDPRLLVLDEPANGLDPAGIRDMRALVKRLAGSGLTVLLSSHDMGEVEQICDDVTIMRTGSVVYHGSIAALREQAPQQAHRIVTSNNDIAESLARSTQLEVERVDDVLHVRAPQDRIDSFVATLVAAGVALRELSLDEAPLESLFFMLTESSPDAPTSDLNASDRSGATR